MKKIKFSIIYIICFLFLISKSNSIENKILFKVNNKIITSLDILYEIKYLEILNENFKDVKKEQAFEIAKKSLIREKIKEIELEKTFKEIKIKDQFFKNILKNYFKKLEINSFSDFKDYFNSIGINPNTIEKKITIEILWNQLIFNKYNQRVKIDKQNIFDDLKKNIRQKEFLLSEILFKVKENENLDDKFNLIKSKIHETNFTEAALVYSISDTSNKGGKLGWINITAVSKKIKDKLKDVNIGNFSDPIIIPGGFLILKVNDVREVNNNLSRDEEIEAIIEKKTNEQLNQFSNIFYNKIQKDVKINEL